MFMNCSYKDGRNIKPESIGSEFILNKQKLYFSYYWICQT